MPAETAYVALGSNLGDSMALLRAAIARLRELGAGPLAVSSLWRTTPVGCPEGSPPFVNAAVALPTQPGETPHSLLGKLQLLERAFGRTPKQQHNEARRLDLDLIAFGARRVATPDLTLPHPRAHLRRFVLQPLSEIAPSLILPGQLHPVAHLLAHLHSEEIVLRLGKGGSDGL